MKNGDILKFFFDDGSDKQKVMDSLRIPFCPSNDFQERFPCGSCGTEDGSGCVPCWKKFWELDDGLSLEIVDKPGMESMRNFDIMKQFLQNPNTRAMYELIEQMAGRGVCPRSNFKQWGKCGRQKDKVRCERCWTEFLEHDSNMTICIDPKTENQD